MCGRFRSGGKPLLHTCRRPAEITLVFADEDGRREGYHAREREREKGLTSESRVSYFGLWSRRVISGKPLSCLGDGGEDVSDRCRHLTDLIRGVFESTGEIMQAGFLERFSGWCNFI